MNLIKNIIKLIYSFLYKDVKTLNYYKFHSIIKFLFSFVQIVIFYYLCSIVSKEYFKFLFFGLFFSKIFFFTATTLTETIKQEQFSQTIYNIFSIPYHELTILTSLFFAKTIFFFFELIIFILCFILFFNIKLSFFNIIFLFFYTIYIILVFLWYTISLCSITVLIKKSEHFIYLLNSLIDILSGVYFPTTFLPKILQHISFCLPTTYILSFLRNAVLYSKYNLTLLIYPTIIGTIFLPISILFFNIILKKLLRDGRIAIY